MGASKSTPNPPAAGPKARADARKLCRDVAGGDRNAAERLARAVMPTARTIARRMTRHESDAQDATQLAVLEILRVAGSYRGDGSLHGWARTISVRTVGRWCARAAQRRTHEPVQAETLVTADIEEGLAQGLPRELGEYLSLLTPPQRNALLLRHSYGCTVPEIAEITHSPVPTVKSRLKTSLEKLRQAVRRDLQLGRRGKGGVA